MESSLAERRRIGEQPAKQQHKPTNTFTNTTAALAAAATAAAATAAASALSTFLIAVLQSPCQSEKNLEDIKDRNSNACAADAPLLKAGKSRTHLAVDMCTTRITLCLQSVRLPSKQIYAWTLRPGCDPSAPLSVMYVSAKS